MKKQYFIYLIAFLLLISVVVFVHTTYRGESLSRTSLENPSDDLMLGQSFIVGIPIKNLDLATKNFLTYVKPAGIILYERNYQDQKQLTKLITSLQEVARTTTGKDYLILVDEEPGGATRFNLFNNVFSTGKPNWELIEKDIQTMHDLGITVNLAPVADFPFNQNSFIRSRLPAHTIANTIDFNSKFIALLQKYNIASTVKHFPGLGVFTDDTHRGITHGDFSKTYLDQSLEIFQSAINNGSQFVMTNHGVYDDLDPKTSVTVSHTIVTELLKNKLSFKGIIITDDLSDMPILTDDTNPTGENIASKALKAGHTLLIFSHNNSKTEKIYDQLLLKIASDTELKTTIKSNFEQIIEYKK